MKRITVRPEVCLWVEFMLLNEFYRNNGLHKNMPEDIWSLKGECSFTTRYTFTGQNLYMH